MARPKSDWYAGEWLAYRKKRQADVVRDLGWNKARISLTIRGIQAYSREDVNDLASYLQLEPFKLLLPPKKALALRKLCVAAKELLAD